MRVATWLLSLTSGSCAGLGAMSCLVSSPDYAPLLRFAFVCAVISAATGVVAIRRGGAARWIEVIIVAPMLGFTIVNLVGRHATWL